MAASSPGYELNDLGFVPTVNDKSVRNQLSWQAVKPGRFIIYTSGVWVLGDTQGRATEAAAVNPMNLVAIVLLSTQKLALDDQAMERKRAELEGRKKRAAFRTKVVPILRTYPFVRIWHAGCSTGEEVYSSIYSMDESPLERGVIWVGANDGPVHVTRDGGRTWRNVADAINAAAIDPAIRVLVIAGGDKQREAREAGADEVGGEEIPSMIDELPVLAVLAASLVAVFLAGSWFERRGGGT